MTRPKQKEKEEIYLTLFRELYEQQYGIGFPEGQIISNEDPDFLVKGESSTLGIEFTSLYDKDIQATNSYSPAAQHSFREKIKEEGKKYCEEKGVPPIEVKVWFNPIENLIGAESQKKLGVYLGRLVEKLSRRSNSSTTVLREPRSKKLKFISQVSIALAGNWLGEHRWHQYFITETNTTPIDALQNRITEKNKKHEDYLENCQECWLVIVVDIRNDAQQFDVNYDQKTKRHKYRSKFSHVFYMDFVRKELTKLEASR